MTDDDQAPETETGPAESDASPAAASTGTRRQTTRAALAGFLSFLWPGGGQAYRGERRRALIQASPVALVALAVIGAVLVLGPLIIVVHLFNPAVSLTLIVLIVALAIWRAWSVADAVRPTLSGPGRLSLVAWSVLLITLVGVTHGWLAYTVYAFYHAGQVISQPIVADPGTDPGATPDASLAPGQPPGSNGPPGAGTSPTPSGPLAPLPGAQSRVTILFVGVDNTHTVDLGLTDTLMVASFDPVSHSLAMISVPRDMTRMPLYSGGEWHARINSLMQSAYRHPDQFPDGPMGTLVNEMSYVIGIPIDYYAQVDIAGFSQLIDAVGGVDIQVDKTVDDPGYQFSPTETGFHLDPGLHHLDGKYATAYVRSRHGSSDYDRAARQQKLLLALRAKLNDPQVLLNLPQMVAAASQVVRTDAPLDRLPEVVSIVQGSESADTQRIVLAPPTYAQGVFDPFGDRTFQNELKMDAVAQLSIQLFGDLSRYSENSPDQLP